MRTGTVKFFNESKGYGFITDEETGKTFCSCFRNAEELREGDRVSYEEEEGRKGKVAAKVAVIYKKFIFCLRMSKTFRFIRNVFLH
jgi:CspA family cold shock protein